MHDSRAYTRDSFSFRRLALVTDLTSATCVTGQVVTAKKTKGHVAFNRALTGDLETVTRWSAIGDVVHMQSNVHGKLHACYKVRQVQSILS